MCGADICCLCAINADSPQEDITSILYDIFDFIEAARCPPGGRAGNVLIHCSLGVSRSASLAIGYLMWRTGGGYRDVFESVKAHRGVTNPNVGFMCQLMEWQVGDRSYGCLHHRPAQACWQLHVMCLMI
jgi:protein-tyrosine phosphatase